MVGSELLWPINKDISVPAETALGNLLVSGQSPEPYLVHCVQEVLQSLPRESWYPSLFGDEGGKMFGVLVARVHDRAVYLRAFSGKLAGEWAQSGFVPPVFNTAAVSQHLTEGERGIAALSAGLEQSGLREKCRTCQVRIASLQAQMTTEMAQVHFSLARRKRHRRIHRERISSSGPSLPSLAQQRELQRLDRQSQQDKKRRKSSRSHWQQLVDEAHKEFATLEAKRLALQARRAALSSHIQERVFTEYKLADPQGQLRPLTDFFAPNQPPGGAGDCAAPKLLDYANQRGYRSIGLAEFWVGAPPPAGVRRHGYFYPPCRAKCGPILPWLAGEYLQSTTLVKMQANTGLEFIYEDASIAVINKPAGLLSTPGKSIKDSVFTRFAALRADLTGALLVHRLDMDTSGLLLLAKTAAAHKALQQQFIKRSVTKTYVALLEGEVADDCGRIRLPLRVDIDDRPRQLVCASFGKRAETRFTVLARRQGQTRILFQPITGRTHQLRVHAAHHLGLNAPIVGDPLYGCAADRMLLHAESLRFVHPANNKPLELTCPAGF